MPVVESTQDLVLLLTAIAGLIGSFCAGMRLSKCVYIKLGPLEIKRKVKSSNVPSPILNDNDSDLVSSV
jgi:hypothetical protein